MRNIKARRRFQLVLSMLLGICVVLLLEDRIEAFVPEIKNFAEIKVEEALKGRIKFSIGTLEGGILHPITLNEVKIKDKKDAGFFPSLVINNVKTNYRIWDVLFRRKDEKVFMSNLLANASYMDVNFVTHNRELLGFVRIESKTSEVSLKGYVSIFGGDKIDFTGSLKEDRLEFELRPKRGTVNIEAIASGEGELIVKFRTEHVDLHGFDFTCDGVVRNKFRPESEGSKKISSEGELELKNIVLNYKPFLALKTSYRVSGGVLQIKDLNFSEILKANGTVILKRPYKVDAVVTANNLSLSWLFLSMGFKDATSVLTGTMNGKFEFKGTPRNLKTDISIEIKKGTMATMDFDYLTAHLKGEGPILRIEESRITRESGYFALAGEINFAKPGASLFDGVKMASDDNAITWDRLNTTRGQDGQELRMTKRITDEINLDFKKLVASGKVDESTRPGDEVQVEYRLHPNDSLKVVVGQEEEFLGLEHKNKF